MADTDTARLAAILDRVIDEAVERWHTTVNDEPRLCDWIGLTEQEYKAWVEGGIAALSRRPVADERDEMLRLAAEDTSYADLRQNIEFMRAGITEALATLEERTACHCHLHVDVTRISEIRANPPRACPRCKAIGRIRHEIAAVVADEMSEEA